MSNVVNEYGYIQLDADQTQDFITIVSRLFDKVYNTNGDFEKYFEQHVDVAEDDPAELFENVFECLEELDMSKYQQQFFDYSTINIRTPFKWFKRNGGAINLSPKQYDWFRRKFEKHNIGHHEYSLLSGEKPTFSPMLREPA